MWNVCLLICAFGYRVQELTAKYLEQLSSGVSLSLAAFRPATKSGAAEVERITKVCYKRDVSNINLNLNKKNVLGVLALHWITCNINMCTMFCNKRLLPGDS